MEQKKIFVSGCYDMLHSGHVAFFEEAAQYGDLYVGIGSDRTIFELKARKPFNNELERLYMVKSLKAVKDAWVNKGSGLIDFLEEITLLKPDIFFVNSDGHSILKEHLCREQGIKYVVSKRIPHNGLPVRSTTALREDCHIPYRIDLAGGWLDQPRVSALYPGPVLTISIEPDYDFNDRSGMSTSSRKKAIELWQVDIPAGDRETLARTLFCYENPPGSQYISGSQDALGIVLPGLNRLNYKGDYWPSTIDNNPDNDTLDWLEANLWLIPLYPRESKYNVLADTNVTKQGAQRLSEASVDCWEAIKARDTRGLGEAVRRSFEAQIAMFPNMVNDGIFSEIDQYRNTVDGWKLSGAGGGGYMIFVSSKPVEKAIKIRIRRK
ncbi:MAG: adenylyltransferase/cytidyltransferase family protein [Dysgonamonadaceae bacterium]|jgi:cytidyltransferase-like protein|nr:adenylyltransferase/cytidyltransferase family protein [Dysgonamonadaceae bacterium]